MNPPPASSRDVDALREGVADGTITILATDHAPHTADEKARPFAERPSASSGSRAPCRSTPSARRDRRDRLVRLVELLTVEPAKLCRLDDHGLGHLRVGGPADVTLIDPDLEWTLTRDELAGRSHNTPFLGRRLRGRAVATIVGGVIRTERGHVLANT
ncbi:MAG: amidohydrolase family protein [Phycisphaerales bacterium]